VYFGKGFTHTEVYNLPIFLRNFYIKETESAIRAQNKAEEKAAKGQSPSSGEVTRGPNIKR
jgi:hypothetical protein